MKGYRKITENYIDVDIEETEDDADLADGICTTVNMTVVSPILDCAKKTGIVNYKVVIYKKVKN